MKIIPDTEAQAHLGIYLDQIATEGPVLITRQGRAIALLLAPTDDDDLERLLMAHSTHLQTILDKSRRSIRAGKGVPHDEFWQKVEESTKVSQPSQVEAKAVKRNKGSQGP